jgi:hypothetical protein
VLHLASFAANTLNLSQGWTGVEFNVFGDCCAYNAFFNNGSSLAVIPEHFLRIDEVTGKPIGLVPRIEKISITERHRVIKVWRALWKKMKAMGGYVGDREDPAKSFANSAPDPRQDIWLRREVLKLVQVAWRHKYYGLAACMATAWDSMLSPIDARPLVAGQASRDAFGLVFLLDRAKTGKAAAATLSTWSQAILLTYLDKLGLELLDTTPLFWTRGGKPMSRKGKTGQWGGDHGGGAHVKPRPYSKDRLEKDFAKVRELAFGSVETRQLGDIRRSGAVQGDAGGGSVTDQANKMANTVDTNKRLRKTYNPTHVASVRRFDEARATGARLLEQRPDESVTSTALVTLLKTRRSSKSLK